jgi:glycosyltransferase involved in cell wall biosynthesis
MNILYARNADFDFPEANKIQVINMCRAFNENGYNTTLLAFGKNIEKIKEKYGIKNYFQAIFIKEKIRFFLLGDIILFLSFLIKNKEFKNIYTRDVIFAILAKLFFKRKKVFLEIHDIPKKCWWKLIYKKSASMLDCIVVISQGLRDGFIELGVNKKNIIVLHDAVNLSDFDISISKEIARKKVNLPLEKTIVAYIGSTKEDHDIKILIEAAKKMKDIYFVIFGKEEEYIKKASLELLNFKFKGYTEQPALAYKAADILFAGYSEKVPWIKYMSPLKVFEYMASKRPTIVADFPRTREILDESETYFYKSGDSNDIVNKIKEILGKKEESEKKAENAFIKAKNCTWKKRASEIILLMEN